MLLWNRKDRVEKTQTTEKSNYLRKKMEGKTGSRLHMTCTSVLIKKSSETLLHGDANIKYDL
jgi:hypothetical protein